MPYILLVIGLIIGLYALYRFFLKADVQQIKSLFLTAALLAVFIALFYMSVTGRLAAALGLVLAAGPIALALYRERKKKKEGAGESASGESPMTTAEALDILGLKDDASEDDIRAAYKKLMKKVHPDQEGSEWMATKLNNAKYYLLSKK